MPSIQQNTANECVKEVQLAALKFLISYFDKHQIEYFVIAGTLLGTIRHQGFIPWDDDIDIGLRREEYEKFRVLFEKEFNDNLQSSYFLQNWHTEKEFAMPFSKLRVNQTIYKEFVTKDVNFHHGIYIDIFPFDDVHSSIFQKFLQHKISTLIHKIILIKSNYIITNQKLQFFLRKLMKFLPKQFLINTFEKLARVTASNNDIMVCTGGSYGFEKEVVRKEWFDSLIYDSFENIQIKIPSQFKDYLTNLYNDFMVIPKSENRGNRHNIIQIEIKKNDI
ncbi:MULTISPECIES: LicD family protein [Exiguobacterium]|uniref:LicD family protein n=1 Tax=Exiguobacterium sp. UBA1053 TaxID=1946487 RepID=UPI0025C58C48|nr:MULTISPECIES: LicD family protein [Exiguobacterium]